jgi:CRISPR-associated protein Cmr2
MAHVLIVTLGPIQDFIAAARRTRDLWFGSWLLSELSKATARAMMGECGLEALVFPGVSKPEELSGSGSNNTSVANKIVVRLPEGKVPLEVARRGEQGMKKRLEELRDQAFGKIAAQYFILPTAQAQVDDLIEYTWVSAPERGPDGYPEARRKAEELLAARKNTRLWTKVAWGAEVPKSSIDGERESVLHEDLFDRVGKKDGLTPEQVRKRYGVGPTERLCGVGLLKRHGIRESVRYAHRFLSTGHLAAWPLYDRLVKTASREELDAAWRKYLDVLEGHGVDLSDQEIVQGPGWEHSLFKKYDGSLLFENRLPELFEEITDTARRQEALRQARSALSDFLKKIGVSTPLAYYAILQGDGDKMGKAIERQDSFKKHRDLSRELDQFAQRVRTIVEGDHGGVLVYSGGDDVLAFVPLHRAVDCAQALAAKFREQLAGFPVDEKGNPPTLSVGIGISHFMDPLRGALRLAREAESLAKQERNSLAVIVDKRSGPPVKVVGIWGTLDQRLKAYVQMHRKDEVPDGAAYELRELGRLLDHVQGAERATLEELVRSEAKRILRRKQPEHGEEKTMKTEVLGRLQQDLKDSSVDKIADELIVARLLAQAAEEADPTEKTGGRP